MITKKDLREAVCNLWLITIFVLMIVSLFLGAIFSDLTFCFITIVLLIFYFILYFYWGFNELTEEMRGFLRRE